MVNGHRLITNDWSTLDTLLDQWKVEWPQCGVLVLLPEAEQARMANVQAKCNEHKLPLLGGVFPALVTPQGFCNQGAWVLRFNTMPACFLLDSLSGDAVTDAGLVDAQVKHLLASAPQHDPAVFLVLDGILPHIDSLLMRLHDTQDSPIHWSGVNAGSETFQPMPCLFDNQRIVSNGVMGWVLPPSTRTVVRHGYRCPKACSKPLQPQAIALTPLMAAPL